MEKQNLVPGREKIWRPILKLSASLLLASLPSFFSPATSSQYEFFSFEPCPNFLWLDAGLPGNCRWPEDEKGRVESGEDPGNWGWGETGRWGRDPGEARRAQILGTESWEIGDLNNNLNFDKLLQIKEISHWWPGYKISNQISRSDRRCKDKRDIRSMI